LLVAARAGEVRISLGEDTIVCVQAPPRRNAIGTLESFADFAFRANIVCWDLLPLQIELLMTKSYGVGYAKRFGVAQRSAVMPPSLQARLARGQRKVVTELAATAMISVSLTLGAAAAAAAVKIALTLLVQWWVATTTAAVRTLCLGSGHSAAAHVRP
jgi:hypothetical protein